MKNKLSQTSTGSGSTATVTTLASTAVGMVLVIPEALFTAIEAALQTSKFNTDPTGYAEVTQSLTNKTPACNNTPNEAESSQTQLDVT